MTSEPASLFQKLLDAICSRSRGRENRLRIVQVGANDGRINDPLFDLVRKHADVTALLLIEPQEDVVGFLADNYRYHADARIWNGAIGDPGQITFYRLKTEYYDVFRRRYLTGSPSYRVPTGFTSSDYAHVLRHVEGNLPEAISPQDAIEKVTYRTTPLADVMQAVGWEAGRIDVLQVDAEGSDDHVLYASNLRQHQPVLINFEHKHLPEQRRAALAGHLDDNGYVIRDYDGTNAVAINRERAAAFGIRIGQRMNIPSGG